MPSHQRGKGIVGVAFRELAQQRAVIRWLHLPASVRPALETDK
jgi:hypothetical protein